MALLIRRTIPCTLIMALWAAFAGCASGIDVASTREPTDHIGPVLVLPFQDMSSLHGTQNNVRSPMTGKVFQTGPVSENAAGWMTAELIARIRQQTPFVPVSSSGLVGMAGELERIRSAAGDTAAAAAALGRRFKADGVFVGYLYRFEQRVGADYGADRPAAVAFDLYLVGVREGRVLWSGTYDEVQKPLTEDLGQMGLFFQRGGKWVTAEEMAGAALTAIFDELTEAP